MSRISAADYYESHESRESLCEDIHPFLRRRYISPLKPRANCRACGFVLDIDELTEDLLCCECDAEVKKMEEGKT